MSIRKTMTYLESLANSLSNKTKFVPISPLVAEKRGIINLGHVQFCHKTLTLRVNISETIGLMQDLFRILSFPCIMTQNIKLQQNLRW